MRRLQFSDKSLHVRIYNSWLRLGGTKPASGVNLCHYIRVLLIWAPLRWFFHGRIKHRTNPFAGLVLLSFIALIAMLTYRNPSGAVSITWKFVALAALFVGFVAACIAIDDWQRRNERTVKKLNERLSVPFIWVMDILLRTKDLCVAGVVLILRMLLGTWFFRRYLKYHWLNPMSVTFCGVVGLFAWWRPEVFITILLFGVVSIAFLVAFFGGVALSVKATERWEFLNKLPSRIRGALREVSELAQLGKTFIVTKKQGSRVCPFIEIERS